MPDRRYNAFHSNLDDVQEDQRDDCDRQQHHVQAVHLAEVEDVEEPTDAGSVDGVLGIHRDPLGIEVLLGEVAGEGGEDADGERDDADHPGGRPAFTPARHEVLAPEVQHHEDEEHLNAPEVEAVEKAADTRKVPPLGPERRQYHSTKHHPDQRRDGDDPEDVDPGADIERLPVRKEVFPGKAALELASDPGCPAAGRLVADMTLHTVFSFSGGEPCPGNGRIKASAKRTTMSPMRIRFGQEMRMKPQWR